MKYSFHFAAVGAAVAFIVFLLQALSLPARLNIDMANDGAGEGQIFVDTGKGYLPQKAKTLALMPDGKTHAYAIDIISSLPKSIRFDPGSTAGNIRIEKMEFESALYFRELACDDFRLLHALAPIQPGVSTCELTAVAEDPYFDFDIFTIPSFKLFHIKWQAIAEGLSYAAITFFLIIAASRTRSRETTNSDKWLTNSRCIRLYAILLFGFLSFVFLRLHVSSVDEWKHWVSTDIHSGVIFGDSQAIRSDEWLVSTPFYASQAANGFAVNNPSLGPENVTLTSSVPVQGVYGYTQPRFWGFYLMVFERGFSWLYAWRVFGLLLVGFTLFSILTKGDFWLSLTGSAWIALSPFVQWWFGTNLPDMVIGFAGGVTSLYMLLRTTSLRTVMLSAVILFFAGISFVSALYPAFLLPLFYLALFLVGGLIFRDSLIHSFIHKWRQKTFLLLLAIGAVLWVFAIWLNQASEVISLVQNSVYPGKRISLGGGALLTWLFSGFFSPFLRMDRFPSIMGNVCEASNFLLLFPLAWFVMLSDYRRTRCIDPVNFALSLYIVLMLVWIVIGYPEWLAVYTKMSMSPPKRALIGLGLASIFLVVSVFSETVRKTSYSKKEKKKTVVVRLFALMIALSGVSYWLSLAYPDFITWQRTVIVVLVLTLLGFAFIDGKKFWLCVLTGLFSLNGLFVSPLVHGVSSLKNSELSSVFIEDNRFGETKWLVIPTIVHPQYFKANGATVWNGTKFISDPNEMSLLDPTDRYRDVWNRYAHFAISPLPPGSSAEFELKTTDTVLIKVDICSNAVSELGINRFAFLTKPELNQFPCLEPIRNGPVAGTWLYKKTFNR